MNEHPKTGLAPPIEPRIGRFLGLFCRQLCGCTLFFCRCGLPPEGSSRNHDQQDLQNESSHMIFCRRSTSLLRAWPDLRCQIILKHKHNSQERDISISQYKISTLNFDFWQAEKYTPLAGDLHVAGDFESEKNADDAGGFRSTSSALSWRCF